VDIDIQTPVDARTERLLEENRALRELLAAQALAARRARHPSLLRLTGWLLATAPGAALMRTRDWLGGANRSPLSGRRVGRVTLMVLYTLALYGALVLLVVYWSTPGAARPGSRGANPQRVPLPALAAEPDEAPEPAPAAARGKSAPLSQPEMPAPVVTSPAMPPSAATSPAATSPATPAGPAAPALRMTEIPAVDPMAWVSALQAELTQCAALGFFARPDCVGDVRRSYCEPNRGWGVVKECQR